MYFFQINFMQVHSNSQFIYCLLTSAGPLGTYPYLPRIEERDEEEEMDECLASHLQIILATPERRSRSPSQVATLETTPSSKQSQTDEVIDLREVAVTELESDRVDGEGTEADTTLDSGLSRGSSDENITNTSEDSLSLCLQSSAESVAERETKLDEEISAGRGGTDLEGSRSEADTNAGLVSDDGDGPQLSEVAIELEDEECPSGKSSKNCGSEEVQERAYQALL